MIKLKIIGEPASKANSRALVTNPKTKKPMFIKSKKALAYLKAVEAQVPVLPELLLAPLRVSIKIFYASYRPDLDESLILDALQKRIYKNDRQVREKHIYHAIDRDNPRALVKIEVLP